MTTDSIVTRMLAWITRNNVEIDHRAKSRMGDKGASAVINFDRKTRLVNSRSIRWIKGKSMMDDEGAWYLAHEIGHLVDFSYQENGQIHARPPVMGMGLISGRIAADLRAAERFLVGLTPVSIEIRHKGSLWSEQDLAGEPKTDAVTWQVLRNKMFAIRLRANRNKASYSELWAEAFACGLIFPDRLRTASPILHDVVAGVLRAQGLVSTTSDPSSESSSLS